MQLIFGIGALWGQRTDVSGVGPDQFAILQNNELDFSFELKELYSQLQFPVDIARGKGKITGKAKMARVFGALYADLFFGATTSTGESPTVAENELQSVPGSGPYTVTVTNAATFQFDLGVYYATTGKRFTQVASVAAAGQYSVNLSTGVYTFYLADANQQVAISYGWNNAAAGLTIPITNNYMGTTPTFSGSFYQNRATQGSAGQLTLRLNLCVSSHLTFPSKIDDYGIPDFDFQALSPASGAIGTLSTSE